MSNPAIELFCDQVVAACALQPNERHARLLALHRSTLDEFIAALQRISLDGALQHVRVNGDSRTVAQLVGHLLAWTRYDIQAVGDVIGGVARPRGVESVSGFVQADGTSRDFADFDTFNAYFSQAHAQAQTASTWPQLRDDMIDAACAFYALFEHPHLANAACLERTLPYRKQLANSVWLANLQHIAIEHVAELGITPSARSHA